MESLTNVKTGVLTVIGIIGGFLAGLLGGWDTSLQTLLIFMAIDYGLGLYVAGKHKKSTKTESGGVSSEAAWKGIFKKVISLSLIVIAQQLDVFLEVEYIRNGLIIALIVDELISFAEHYAMTGKKVPPILLEALDLLQKKKVKGDGQ